MPTCFIAIGSNINPQTNLQACAKHLRAAFPGIAFSSVYKTAARDVEEQEDFLNAVARMETDATIDDIMEMLRAIEQKLKKNPPYPKGPRTIDLDLLLYGDEILQEAPQAGKPPFEIPHPAMIERRFMLEPLCEMIDPKSLYPGSATSFADLLKKTLDQRCEKTDLRL